MITHQHYQLLYPHPINIIVHCGDLYVCVPVFYLYPHKAEEPVIKPVWNVTFE